MRQRLFADQALQARVLQQELLGAVVHRSRTERPGIHPRPHQLGRSSATPEVVVLDAHDPTERAE